MKRIFSILFLLAICVQSFSNLYIIASFYINRDYVGQNLCVNRFDAVQVCKGKCYLTKELKQQEQQQNKFPDLKQKEINLYCEHHQLANPSGESGIILCLGIDQKTDNYSFQHLASVFHPPLSA